MLTLDKKPEASKVLAHASAKKRIKHYAMADALIDQQDKSLQPI